MLLEFPYVHEHKAGDCMVEQTAKRKVSCFFLFLVGRTSFHCLKYSNEIQLKRQQTRKKKKKKKEKKAEISIRD